MTEEPKPLTEEDLEKIEAHHRINTSDNPPIAPDMLRRDIPRLVAEIRRLRAKLADCESTHVHVAFTESEPDRGPD